MLVEAAPVLGSRRGLAPGTPTRPALTPYAVAEVGPQREHQEDAYGFKLPGKLSPGERKRGMLFVVADGVGGEKAGELASRIAVQSILRAYYDGDGPGREGLRQAIAKANTDIFEQAKVPAFARMATTVVCALVKGGLLVVAHVGDSRAYLYRDRRLLRLTTDHSWVAEEVHRKRMTLEEAARSPMRHVITRSLGRRQSVEAEVVSYGPVREGDRVLLCTDGLHDAVSEKRMAEVLQHCGADEACSRLARLAIDGGSGDNITVLLVEVSLTEGEDESCEPEPTAPSPPAEVRRDETEPRNQQLVAVESLPSTSETAEDEVFETPLPPALPDAQNGGSRPELAGIPEAADEVDRKDLPGSPCAPDAVGAPESEAKVSPIIAEWVWEACRPRMDLEAKEQRVPLPGNREISVQLDFPAKDPTCRLLAVRLQVECHPAGIAPAGQTVAETRSIWIMPFAWAQEAGGMAMVGRTGSQRSFEFTGASVTCEVDFAACNTAEERFFKELVLRFRVEAGPAQAAA